MWSSVTLPDGSVWHKDPRICIVVGLLWKTGTGIFFLRGQEIRCVHVHPLIFCWRKCRLEIKCLRKTIRPFGFSCVYFDQKQPRKNYQCLVFAFTRRNRGLGTNKGCSRPTDYWALLVQPPASAAYGVLAGSMFQSKRLHSLSERAFVKELSQASLA